MRYEPHPIADIFPMMVGADFAALQADIAARGLLNPIVLYEGKILDGRNRAKACEAIGKPLRLIEYIGDDPLGDVISWNLHRRHLDESQRSMVAGRIANLTKADAGRMGAAAQGKATANLPLPDAVSQSEAAERLNVGERSVRSAKKVLSDGVPELIAAVDGGEVPVSVAEKVAKMPEEQQRAVVENVKKGEKPKEAIVAVKRDVIAAAVVDAKVPAEPSSKPDVKPCAYGEWYAVGEHRVYCGSSTDDVFKEAARCAGASLVFADPPYNAGVDEWDVSFEWRHDYLIDCAPLVVVTPGIASIQGFLRTTSMPYKWSVAGHISNGMTRGPLGFGNWIFGAVFSSEKSIHRTAQDAWSFPIKGDSTGHRGQKPYEFMARIIESLCDRGDLVIDPFGGSGTTAFVGHRLGRKTMLAEIDIAFCDAILKRLEAETGHARQRVE